MNSAYVAGSSFISLDNDLSTDSGRGRCPRACGGGFDEVGLLDGYHDLYSESIVSRVE